MYTDINEIIKNFSTRHDFPATQPKHQMPLKTPGKPWELV